MQSRILTWWVSCSFVIESGDCLDLADTGRLCEELFGRFRGQELQSLPQEATKQRNRTVRRRLFGAPRKNAMNENRAEARKRKPRRTFDEAYRRHAVGLTLNSDRPVSAIAEALGIEPYKLYRWREQYAPMPGEGGVPRTLDDAAAEIQRLRAEVLRLRERELVLKKSLGILSETPGSGMPKSRA